MYIAPGQGQTTPWGQNFDVHRNSLSLCPFVAILKRISLKSDFLPFFMCFFSHVYSPRQGQTTHWRHKNFMTTERPFLFAHMLKVSKWLLQYLILYTFLMTLYMYMYIARGKGRKPLWDKFLMSTESPYHFDHLLQVSNKPLWTKFWCQQKGLVTLPICCRFQKIS